MLTDQRIQWLRLEIQRHDHLYYVLDKPEIGDGEYDALLRELQELEQGLLDSIPQDSPTQRVGGAVRDGFKTVQHAAPMLSLQSSSNPDDVKRWDEQVRKELHGHKAQVGS